MKALGGRETRRTPDESEDVGEVEGLDATAIGVITEGGTRGSEIFGGGSHGPKLEECPYLGVPRTIFARGTSG